MHKKGINITGLPTFRVLVTITRFYIEDFVNAVQETRRDQLAGYLLAFSCESTAIRCAFIIIIFNAALVIVTT